MFGMAPLTPLLRPAAYFRRSDRPSLELGALVVIAYVVLSAALVWWFSEQLIATTAPSAEAAAEARGTVSGLLTSLVVVLFVGWPVLSLLLHAFVWLSKGGRFRETMAVVGESHVASLALLPVTALGFYLLLRRLPSEPGAAVTFMRRATSEGSAVLLGTSLATSLWRAAIQAFGLAEAQEIEFRPIAAVTFGLAVLGFLLGRL